jgi:glucans biosynthesis protein
LRKNILMCAVGVAAAVALMLSGCAPPSTIKRIRYQAHKALAKSNQALAVSRAEAARERRAEQTLRAEVAKLAASESVLERRLVATRVTTVATTPSRQQLTNARTDAIFSGVVARARALAATAYKVPAPIAPVLQKLSFVDYGKVRLIGRVPGWPSGTRFHVQLAPTGYLFRWPEKIYVVADGKTRLAQLPVAVKGDPALAKQIHGPVLPAGFSVYTPFGTGPGVDEFLSFLGASYFRAVGANQSLGLSARGVAVDTALSHRAEEFPFFRAFWILAPAPSSRRLSFCALLDSRSLTGAYRFVVKPGITTTIDVKAVLFERHHIRRLGIAPLTSMFLQGRFSHHRFHRLIRSAHDSDGLLVATGGGQHLWWPLRNPRRLVLYRFPLTNPEGFGLMQRARRAQDYRAFGMHYEDRPSAWITPRGNWGPGHLLLVELPTNSQTNDNISVFWVPKDQAKPGQPLIFSYRIAWQGANPPGASTGYVSASRHNDHKGRETYVINFRGVRLSKQAAGAVHPVIHVQGPARIVNPWVAWDQAGDDWRLQFTAVSTGSGPVMLHAALANGKTRLTETWADVFPLH